MDPASGMENALGRPGSTAAAGRAFPTPLWTAHTTRRPQAPQAVIILIHKHDNASRISKTVTTEMEGD